MLHLLFYVTQHHPFAACEHSEQTFLVVLIYVLACVVYVVNVTQTNTDRHRHRQKEREREALQMTRLVDCSQSQ